uniref:Putative secreted protein n=1 Tax=Ixodes ricinus TaxID=34613 RepID=A0A6B0U9Y6_IXORI
MLRLQGRFCTLYRVQLMTCVRLQLLHRSSAKRCTGRSRANISLANGSLKLSVGSYDSAQKCLSDAPGTPHSFLNIKKKKKRYRRQF